MRTTPPAWVRFPAICALGALLLIFVPLAWVLRRLTGGTLIVAEWAETKFNELREAGQ